MNEGGCLQWIATLLIVAFFGVCLYGLADGIHQDRQYERSLRLGEHPR